VTQPEDDLTELSARNKEAEDVTVLSRRSKQAPPEDDDVTKLSSRSAPAEDATRVVRRTPRPASPQTGARADAHPTPLPPGVPAATVAERGTFGQPTEEYETRAAPEIVVPASPPPTVRSAPAEPTPDAARARSRREAARHRRLITAVIVVGVTAAIMTAAVFGIVALVGGGT
jgi:hypothetical protein